MLTQNINSLFATLGCPIGDDYIVSDDCQGSFNSQHNNLICYVPSDFALVKQNIVSSQAKVRVLFKTTSNVYIFSLSLIGSKNKNLVLFSLITSNVVKTN